MAEDKRNIKMFALRYRHNITNQFYLHHSLMFKEELQVLNMNALAKRMTKLAGWSPLKHECYINPCMAFTGPYSESQTCHYCHTPCSGHSYFTLPLAPQLTSLYAGDGDTREKMDHMKETLDSYQDGVYRDIHDGLAVRSLLGKQVMVNRKEQTHHYFEDKHDILLGLMTDGFQCFK
jgi:hypothetical protein